MVIKLKFDVAKIQHYFGITKEKKFPIMMGILFQK